MCVKDWAIDNEGLYSKRLAELDNGRGNSGIPLKYMGHDDD